MNPLSERPDIRRRVYIAFWGLGLTLGAAQTGYAAAQAGQPVWLNVALSVYAFLGAGIGYPAQANTPGYTGEHEATPAHHRAPADLGRRGRFRRSWGQRRIRAIVA